MKVNMYVVHTNWVPTPTTTAIRFFWTHSITSWYLIVALKHGNVLCTCCIERFVWLFVSYPNPAPMNISINADSQDKKKSLIFLQSLWRRRCVIINKYIYRTTPTCTLDYVGWSSETFTKRKEKENEEKLWQEWIPLTKNDRDYIHHCEFGSLPIPRRKLEQIESRHLICLESGEIS